MVVYLEPLYQAMLVAHRYVNIPTAFKNIEYNCRQCVQKRFNVVSSKTAKFLKEWFDFWISVKWVCIIVASKDLYQVQEIWKFFFLILTLSFVCV